MTKMKLAFVGLGFVGSAVAEIFNNHAIERYQVDPRLNTKISQLPKDITATFIAVPTPMNEDGSVNATILKTVLDELITENIGGLFIIKSTVTPDFFDQLSENVRSRLVYNPEFLTERNAVHDLMTADYHIVGGEAFNCFLVEQLYRGYADINEDSYFHYTTREEASMIKYALNSFMFSKVLWLNQLFELCGQQKNIDPATVLRVFSQDSRVGNSHNQVPGHDGRFGAAGACFSKDIPALVKFGQAAGYDFSILREAWNKNVDYRLRYEDLLDREKEQHVTFIKLD